MLAYCYRCKKYTRRLTSIRDKKTNVGSGRKCNPVILTQQELGCGHWVSLSQVPA